MALSWIWRKLSQWLSRSNSTAGSRPCAPQRQPFQITTLWVISDLATIAAAAAIALSCRFHVGVSIFSVEFWNGSRIHPQSLFYFVLVTLGYALILILCSRHFFLYRPERFRGPAHEQRVSLQACFWAIFLTTGLLFFFRIGELSRLLVLLTALLTTALLSLRRLLLRILLHRLYAHGFDRRNVVIAGSGAEAQALRQLLENTPRLGLLFKGFLESPQLGARIVADEGPTAAAFDEIFRQARQLFADEILLTAPCSPEAAHSLLLRARASNIDIRILPDMADALAWRRPIEYIGPFPTIPLYANQRPVLALLIKRCIDVALALVGIVLLSPLWLAAAIAIKLDSPGPVFYCAERIGKKGRVFRCIKFRTMVQDADEQRAHLLAHNERDGVLFKLRNDPRITRVGRFLRKYSIDELPQFLNVLHGEMSAVGPRPPLASEVRQYELEQLRRLDVIPGVTGLWQVEARQNPSFEDYVRLDRLYIESWSLWLDITILFRTVYVVLAGTGS